MTGRRVKPIDALMAAVWSYGMARTRLALRGDGNASESVRAYIRTRRLALRLLREASSLPAAPKKKQVRNG